MILGLRVAIRDKTQMEVEFYPPVVLMGILSALLLCAGVSRHYVDIYRERTVRGISLLFVGIDALGDLTSLVSVVFWWRAGQRLDVLGCVIYAGELVMWVGVLGCAAWFNGRMWVRERLRVWKGGRGGVEVRGAEGGDGVDEGQIERVRASDESGRASIISLGRASEISGTCFRTASGREVEGTSTRPGIDESRHDVVRLRNFVRFDV